jgi:hypothetical protein
MILFIHIHMRKRTLAEFYSERTELTPKMRRIGVIDSLRKPKKESNESEDSDAKLRIFPAQMRVRPPR